MRPPQPIRLVRSGESYQVIDGRGRVLAYIYFEDDEGRRQRMGRLTQAEAEDWAKQIARMARVT